MTIMDTVIREHGVALLSYANRLTADRCLAEDIVQETWLRAWRHADDLGDGEGSVRGWLLRTARNVSIDLYRKRQARPAEVGFDGAALANIAGQAQPSDEVERRMILDELLEDLSPVHRSAVIAVYFADRTVSAAAAVHGVPVGTMKSRVHHALRALRARHKTELQEAA